MVEMSFDYLLPKVGRPAARPPEILLSELRGTSDGNHHGRGRAEIYGFCLVPSFQPAPPFDLRPDYGDIRDETATPRGGRGCGAIERIALNRFTDFMARRSSLSRLFLAGKGWKDVQLAADEGEKGAYSAPLEANVTP
ncbi:hypothetical protein KM043_017894 [Ampulex compressa]|nr:hypothetical protein KM043_017894 [Ampulex compressa]